MQEVRCTTTTIAVVKGLVFAGAVGIGLVPAMSAAKPFNACRVSTNAAYDSCTAGARSDQALAVGKCANLATASAVRACRAQAAADAKDARGSCAEQRKFRIDACSRFGPAPYSPAIDPRLAPIATPYSRNPVSVPTPSEPSMTWWPVYHNSTAIDPKPSRPMRAPKPARHSASREPAAAAASRCTCRPPGRSARSASRECLSRAGNRGHWDCA